MSFFDIRLSDYPIGVFKRFMSHNVVWITTELEWNLQLFRGLTMTTQV